MYVNIEFLDVEPIENVITCMHHKMDKEVFFGYKETIEECKKRTEDFMKKYCGVSEVEFCLIDKLDLDDVVFKIEEKVEAETVEEISEDIQTNENGEYRPRKKRYDGKGKRHFGKNKKRNNSEK